MMCWPYRLAPVPLPLALVCVDGGVPQDTANLPANTEGDDSLPLALVHVDGRVPLDSANPAANTKDDGDSSSD